MTTSAQDEQASHKLPYQLPLAALASAFGAYLGAAAYLGLPSLDLPPVLAALVYGIAIVGGAFILSWAAEAAQVDINAGLALALLALLAVLPEYAVDFVFTWRCGNTWAQGPPGLTGESNVCSLALANMTGANRVLVGIGWPLVVLVAALAVWRARKAGTASEESTSPSTRGGEVRLAPAMATEVTFLGIATLYSLTLPLKSTLTLWDSAVFILIFALYAWRLSRMSPTEPDLIGVSHWVGSKEKRPRRSWVIGMFVVAAIIILLTAEHFAESLVQTGEQLGISQFLLVQWVAPLASESPELIVACLYAWRLKAGDSLGTLLSSKVNQWTLLVGSLPLVFAISALTMHGLPIDTQQRFELLITAAQSLFAVSILIDRSLTFKGAIALLSLFLVQFFVSVSAGTQVNRITIIVLSILYGILAIAQFAWNYRNTIQTVKDGTVTPFDQLSDDPSGRVR
ncbi:cation:H+ antiporter [Halopolyspora algeriensis]|uniref:Cation:H+ antiporter n=1 Tax=Halopolyspora algeriensis TaxID=1500506 RepID=A0A368VYW0_9ACTN|nr:sodium:proton exchanger [Halopolyspora algeriensis]RCW46012.1 cation:H+ antiporter [Halopolyspora algeriensis]TQM55425.1 cation:H+ antiporter [Halopolyspora algeriensis]